MPVYPAQKSFYSLQQDQDRHGKEIRKDMQENINEPKKVTR